MDRLWSPWRYQYISGASGDKTGADLSPSACIFCHLRDDTAHDEANFVVCRTRHNYIVLNLYPYTSGHLLVVPYEHTPDLDALDKHVSDELMDLAKHCQSALRDAYHPDGFNLGLNLGQAAGAGVAGHVHLHVMPRWAGDANFMTTIGETRVIPEALATTYNKLHDSFNK